MLHQSQGLQREERVRKSDGGGGGVQVLLLLCTSLALPTLWQVTRTHRLSAPVLGQQPNYLSCATIHPSNVSLQPLNTLAYENFHSEQFLSGVFFWSNRDLKECIFSGAWTATNGTATMVHMWLPSGLIKSQLLLEGPFMLPGSEQCSLDFHTRVML